MKTRLLKLCCLGNDGNSDRNLKKLDVPRKFEGYNFLLLYSAGVFVFIG